MSNSGAPAPVPDDPGKRLGPAPPANDTAGPGGASSAGPDGTVTATPLFLRNLEDAEALLSYAANTGRFPPEVEAGKDSLKHWVIDGIINARAAVETNRLTRAIAGAFWASYADLSRITRPVTAETLRASASSPIRLLKAWVLVLVGAVIAGSIFLFINGSIVSQAEQLMEQQNAAALRLWSNVQFYQAGGVPERGGGPPAAEARTDSGVTVGRAFAAATQPTAATVARVTPEELFGEVVDFARRSFWLRETAWRLNRYFIPSDFRIDNTPVDFGSNHPEGLGAFNVRPTIRTASEIVDEGIKQIVYYQQIRNFAQAASKTNTVLYAGITNYLLPAVYALLGASLYGLRHYAALVRRKAYLKSSANSARYFIALIAGIVIGLFGSLVPAGLAVPPLAIAFLVGYAVEAFFSRLDGFIERMRGGRSAQPEQPSERVAATA